MHKVIVAQFASLDGVVEDPDGSGGTPEDADRWTNSTLLHGDLCEAVAERLQRQDVIVTGSASIVDQLVARDLVDEFRLLTFPIVLGKGRRLFDGANAPVELDLVSSEDAGSGVLRQIYSRR